MNIQQFQYLLALAELRHFEKAAEQCCISQSTLSTMISRFEEEVGITIFDRKQKPVGITSDGEKLLEQLKIVHREIGQLKELSKELKGEIKGQLSLSVIPTIAPYLLPLFLQQFAKQFPELAIQVREQTTGEIVRLIKSRELDVGIVSIPIKDKELVEIPLYDEPFVYFNANEKPTKNKETKQLDVSNLCLLEEGHCMRTQVVNLCEMHKMNLKNTLNFDYKAGSIDSLMRFVKANNASTLLPYLASLEVAEQEKLSSFSPPIPYRTIGLVVHRHYVKKKALEALKTSILNEIRKFLPNEILDGEMLLPV